MMESSVINDYTILKELIRKFEKLRNENGFIDLEFIESIKKAAQYEAKNVGSSKHKKETNRRALLALHKNGIKYAISSKETSELNKGLDYLDKRINVNTPTFCKQLWKPAINYHRKLLVIQQKTRTDSKLREMIKRDKVVAKKNVAMERKYQKYKKYRDSCDERSILYFSSDDD